MFSKLQSREVKYLFAFSQLEGHVHLLLEDVGNDALRVRFFLSGAQRIARLANRYFSISCHTLFQLLRRAKARRDDVAAFAVRRPALRPHGAGPICTARQTFSPPAAQALRQGQASRAPAAGRTAARGCKADGAKTRRRLKIGYAKRRNGYAKRPTPCAARRR